MGETKMFSLIAGPCVIENEEMVFRIAEKMKDITSRLGIEYYFKASFDKANRTSLKAFRGPGIEEGLRLLAKVKSDLGLKIATDIHEPWQAKPAAEVQADGSSRCGGKDREACQREKSAVFSPVGYEKRSK